MKSAGDELFLLLTIRIIEGKVDPNLFVNKSNGNIYFIETRDKNYYFIASGDFKLKDNGKIDYLKTSNLLFVRNAKTMMATAICRNDILRIIDYTSFEKYLLDLREVFYDVLKNKTSQVNDENTLMTEYKCLLDDADRLQYENKIRKSEDIFDYARRIGNDTMIERYRISDIIKSVDKIIREIWLDVLYEPESMQMARNLILRIMKTTIARINKDNG